MFNNVFSSNEVKMQQWRCSNNKCDWTATSSFSKQILGTTHIDLIKLQVEYGANSSYRSASKKLNNITGQRRINNHMQIRSVTNNVGNILSENETIAQKTAPPKELCAVADGGHVHDANNRGHNFEAMMGKVFQPENLIRIDKNHTKIIKKHCAGSGKHDNQATMKKNIASAAKKEGIDKTKTRVTALADGAKNCWNIFCWISRFRCRFAYFANHSVFVGSSGLFCKIVTAFTSKIVRQ